MADRSGRDRLHYAALANDVAAAGAALTEGADRNAPDRNGFRPLHFAAQQGAANVATLLLDAGADVDATNDFGNTALFIAVFNSRGDGALIGLLRARGANPAHHR